MDNDKIIVERKYIIEATHVENNEYGVTLKVDLDGEIKRIVNDITVKVDINSSNPWEDVLDIAQASLVDKIRSSK